VSQTLFEPRPLDELLDDTSGQLLTEWVLLTAVVVVPIILLVPGLLNMTGLYYQRIAEVICLPFP
jgi:hypothetical protein